ncbi:MAG TPA: UDP-N-acetylmuramate--L-alanine ligase, partial [Myxococcota bacterium]|nr:UDP-N-acetylmuramate--L-alanine ligase [Myxococcota bacterium]
MFRGKVRTIHFVGIGGIGMSGIAEVLINLGFQVTGSDQRSGASVERLRSLGAVVHVGHAAEHVGVADVVVRSSAVHDDNPEVRAAIDAGVPVIPRAEMLAELMRLKEGVAIAGTHGKTTTTSMVAACLVAGGIDPTVVIGGRLGILGNTNARLGTGEYLVAEADESDGSFLLLSPTVALVTNIDPEHLDHYGTVEAMEAAFLAFASDVPFYGCAVLCLDHPVVARMIPQIRRRVITYGLARHADVRASSVTHRGLETSFRVHQGERLLGEITLGMPGAHNVLNALGAIAIANELGVSFEHVARALDHFGGVQRRFTVRGEVGGVMVVDDYGHHPVEIEATLRAADEGFPDRRIIAVFQPHRYTRLRDAWTGFCTAFHCADLVLVCPVYPAGEEPIPGVDHEAITAALREHGHRNATAVPDLQAAVAWLGERLAPGDIVITLGAGSVGEVCGQVLAQLEARS